MAMQPKTRELAYHAIAHALDWNMRATLWAKAGLDPITNPIRCSCE